MLKSAFDIYNILASRPVIDALAKIEIRDIPFGFIDPSKAQDKDTVIVISRYPVEVKPDDFSVAWRIEVATLGEEYKFKILAEEVERSLPGLELQGSSLLLSGTVKSLLTSDVEIRKEDTTEYKKEAQLSQDISERFEDLKTLISEEIGDRMLLVRSGKDGEKGPAGPAGPRGDDGKDLLATDADLEDLKNVEEGLPLSAGQVLTWDGSVWTNLFVRQTSSFSGSGGAGGQATTIDDIGDVDTSTTPPTPGQALLWNDADGEWEPGDVSSLDAVRLDAENKTLVYNGSGQLTNVTGTEVQVVITYNGDGSVNTVAKTSNGQTVTKTLGYTSGDLTSITVS